MIMKTIFFRQAPFTKGSGAERVGFFLQPLKEAGGAVVPSRQDGVARHEGVPVMNRGAFAILLCEKYSECN